MRASVKCNNSKAALGAVTVLFWLCAVSSERALAASLDDFARGLPVEVGGYRLSSPPQTYEAAHLYDYLDGGAELYLTFGVRRVLAFTYTKKPDREIRLDIFDMGSSHNAYGVFSLGRNSSEGTVGQGSVSSRGLLTFWVDRYYVSVFAFPETEESQATVGSLGRVVAAMVPQRGTRPPLVDLLPTRGLVPTSVRFFRHHTWLNSAFFVSDENVLGLGPQTGVALGRYTHDKGGYFLALVEYPNEKTAKTAFRRFTARMFGASGTSLGTVGGRPAGIRLRGHRVVLVLDAQDRGIVDQALRDAFPTPLPLPHSAPTSQKSPRSADPPQRGTP